MTNLVAESRTNGVTLYWDAAEAPAGRTLGYAVAAVGEGGEGDRSPTDIGSRGAAAVVRYEVSVDGGAWLVPASDSLATSLVLDDAWVPLPRIVAGTVTASTTDPTGIRLSAEGFSATEPLVRARVRAVSDAGEGPPSEEVQGQFSLAQPTFEVGAGIDPGCRMRLEEHQVAGRTLAWAVEMVEEARLEQLGRRGVARDVTAQLGGLAIGPHHHRQCVPAHRGNDALLQREVAGIGRLHRRRDGVDVRRLEPLRAHAHRGPRCGDQAVEQECGAGAARVRDHRRQGVEPFARFLRVGVLGGGVVQARRALDFSGSARVHGVVWQVGPGR